MSTPISSEAELEQLRERVTQLESVLSSQSGLSGVLNQREEFYRSVLDSLAEGVIITNQESRIIHVNSRMQEISGYTPEELLGRVSYELLLPPEQWPLMKKRLSERLSGKSAVYEHEMCRKDGSRNWVQVQATPYFNAAGEIVGTVGAISCIEFLKTLEQENEYLRDELHARFNVSNIIGASPALRKVLDQIAMVGPTQANVLILGESGTGKELVARAIHDASERAKKPLVRVNCASIPKELFESEFFGHVRGAFTGAVKDRIGRFELADGGTLFLDEIGEIPLDLQSKLLRVLQEGQFEKVGEDRTRTVNVRVLAATNRDLLEESKAGRFRIDLYYRLSVFPIEIPPLRDRTEDIGPIAESFIRQAARRLGVPAPRLTKVQCRELESYDWPGNVRELQNVVERAVILARNHGRLQFDLGPATRKVTPVSVVPRSADVSATAEDADLSLVDLKTQEKQMLQRALERTGWKVYGTDGAAALLGLRPTTLASKMKKFGLQKP